MKRCREIMTKNIVCCMPNESVVKAAQLMNAKGIGSIPVIENERTERLVGIVTDRDLALGVVGKGLVPKATRVEEVMTRDVFTCRGDDDLQEVLDVMSQYQLRRIPVVDNSNRVIGIIAQADVAMRIEQPEKIAEMVKEISHASVFAMQG